MAGKDLFKKGRIPLDIKWGIELYVFKHFNHKLPSNEFIIIISAWMMESLK